MNGRLAYRLAVVLMVGFFVIVPGLVIYWHMHLQKMEAHAEAQAKALADQEQALASRTAAEAQRESH